ncbi:MAG: DNA translocase FtsK, partial [Sedimentitalea sp.]|nr:DNA translocase FtsK [Sedimentitalea sp.]
MAYQTRSRDPLLDSNMQAAIERRGKELIGIALFCLGLAAAAMIASYTPDDPNWMVSTDAPVQNWMGRIGASIAAPLFMVVGWGSWGIALAGQVWGVRFAFHLGDERALGRVIFAPIAIAVASVYAATLVPGEAWRATHSFGLGGLFGDTVLGMILTLLPFGSAALVKLTSALMAALMVGLGLFSLGFTRNELSRALRSATVGVIMLYGMLLGLLGQGASAALEAARQRRAQRAERRLAAEEAAAQAAFDPRGGAEEARDGRGSFLSRLPSLIRRPDPLPEPELVEPVAIAGDAPMPGDDRIRARIADVIRTRRQADTPPEADKPLTRGLGRRPDPLILDPVRAGAPRIEPPLTGAAYAAQSEAADPLEDEDALEEDALPLQPPAPDLPPLPGIEPRKVVQNPPRKAPAPSRRAQAEAQPGLDFDAEGPGFELPPLSLLTSPAKIERHMLSDEALAENARMLENVLDDYGVKGEITSVRPGPVVTMYELEPAPGLKASRVIGLADDIARSMAALSARVSTVPGRSVIGIELPNENREKVVLREILASRDFGDSNMRLPLALGKDIGGGSMVANLAKMPHLLIAGTTGSGKSVAINTMILSLLYKLTPEECRLIMID